MQLKLIGACELLCAVRFPALQRKFPIVLKNLYDADALDEDVIIGWFEGPPKHRFQEPEVGAAAAEQLRAAAKPLYVWLKEAEASGDDSGDSDDSEDEQDEHEDEEAHPAAAAVAAPAPAPAAAPPAAQEEEGDEDFDVDDI